MGTLPLKSGVGKMGNWAGESLHLGHTLVQFLPEGENMPNLGGIVRELKKQRDRAQREVEQLNAALVALGGRGNSNGRSTRVRVTGKRRPMSASARKKIAAAQRARWTKWKAARRNK